MKKPYAAFWLHMALIFCRYGFINQILPTARLRTFLEALTGLYTKSIL